MQIMQMNHKNKKFLYNIGDKITVNGTIKNHIYEKKNEYMPLTIIKRPKLTLKKERV